MNLSPGRILMSSSASYLEARGFKAFQLCSLLIDLSVSRTLLAILSLASWRCELLRGIPSSRSPRKAPFRPSSIRPPNGPISYLLAPRVSSQSVDSLRSGRTGPSPLYFGITPAGEADCADVLSPMSFSFNPSGRSSPMCYLVSRGRRICPPWPETRSLASLLAVNEEARYLGGYLAGVKAVRRPFLLPVSIRSGTGYLRFKGRNEEGTRTLAA